MIYISFSKSKRKTFLMKKTNKRSDKYLFPLVEKIFNQSLASSIVPVYPDNTIPTSDYKLEKKSDENQSDTDESIFKFEVDERTPEQRYVETIENYKSGKYKRENKLPQDYANRLLHYESKEIERLKSNSSHSDIKQWYNFYYDGFVIIHSLIGDGFIRFPDGSTYKYAWGL